MTLTTIAAATGPANNQRTAMFRRMLDNLIALRGGCQGVAVEVETDERGGVMDLQQVLADARQAIADCEAAPDWASQDNILAKVEAIRRHGPRTGAMQREPFERWLTDDLPVKVHLGKLRKAFEQGLPKEVAVREAM